ncbi:MAG TPA: LacI family DNA-binding transcriptional regulator [Armatimonadota bacterium]|jgi:LacI family transcriptional regulator
MTITINDIAQRAGVTNTTVSLVLRGDARISAKTRQRVLQIAKELHYVPNSAARQLRRAQSRTKVLGILIPDITNPFYALVAHASHVAAAQRHYQVLIGDSQWDPARELEEIQTFIEYRVDGVLGCFCEQTTESFAELDSFGIPHLVLDVCPPGYTGACVLNDMEAAGRLAANHLVEQGYRRLAFMTAEAPNSPLTASQAMVREFRRTLRDLGVPFTDDRVIHAGWSMQEGMHAFPALGRIPGGVDAVVCLNTLCALGVMEAADHQGVRIGPELGLLGVDDLEICQLSRIGLTVIREPDTELTKVGVDLLISSIDAATPPTARLMLQPNLIVRDSTRRE